MPEIEGKSPAYLVVGRIVGAHGIRGEVKVELMTDVAERFAAGASLYLGDEQHGRPVKIVASRPHKGMQLVLLAQVADRNAAEALIGQYLMIREDQAAALGEHENYAHDLIGLNVRTTDGQDLGTLTEILTTGANDVYVVANAEGEVLVPALRDVVLSVDVPGRVMTVALPEGLL